MELSRVILSLLLHIYVCKGIYHILFMCPQSSQYHNSKGYRRQGVQIITQAVRFRVILEGDDMKNRLTGAIAGEHSHKTGSVKVSPSLPFSLQ